MAFISSVAEPKLFTFGSGSTFVPYLAPAPAILYIGSYNYNSSIIPMELEISFSSSKRPPNWLQIYL